MKKIMLILFPVLCYACGNSDRIFDVETKLNLEARESVELAGEKLPLEIMGGYGIKVFDTLLVVTTSGSGHFREVYGLKSYSLLAEVFKKGRAKNEFLFVGYGGQCIEDNGNVNLYIHDLNKNVFWRYDLTKSIKENSDCGEIIGELPGNYHGAYYLAPDIFCYRDVMSDNSYSYVVRNIKENKVIDEFPVINFMGREVDIPVSNYITKDNTVIVWYSFKINQLMFINLKDKTMISVSTSDTPPTWSRWRKDCEDNTRSYYYNVAATEGEIYALYQGNPDHLEIHVFSQTGEFLKRLILKEKIISFDVSGPFIYGLTADEEIYQYKI